QQGKTMIFVSHSIGQMKQFCEKVLWLEYGMVKEYGDAEEILLSYENFLKKWKRMSKKERNQYKEQAFLMKNQINQGILDEYQMNIDDYYVRPNEEISYKETPVSLIGHLKGRKSFVFEDPNASEKVPSDHFKSAVYYIKRK